MFSTVRRVVDGSPMNMYVAVPAPAEHNGAGIVFLHDQHGLESFTFDGVAKLAERGFAVAAPDNFHHRPQDEDLATKKSKLDDRYIINDTRAAFDWLVEQGGAAPRRIGLIGFCQGGRMAFVSASAEHRLRATVVLYGGNMFIPRGDGPTPFERLKHIRCPILALNGARDTNPSPDDMRKIDEELTAHGIAHRFHSFPEAGHAFANHTLPKYHNADAAKQAWQMAIAFLQEQLL